MEGRWILRPNSHPFVSATLEGPRVVATTPVVPCDDAALERAAEAIGFWVPEHAEEIARAVLRAAGETG